MAKFNSETIDHYGGQGGAGYFSLRNDGDSAFVRFLYNGTDDIEGYAVHQIEVDGKKRYINCLREYNQPVDACPLCRDHKPQYAKLFIPLYNEDEKKVQIWERGKKTFAKISGICARYGTKGPIVSKVFEIQRNGKAGDQQTTYEIYPTDEPAADVTLDDYEIPNPLGTIILDKSKEDIEFFLSEGYFPPTENDMPVRRTSSHGDRTSERDSDDNPPARRRPMRRTPANDDDRNF